jgi:hypothetical protein
MAHKVSARRRRSRLISAQTFYRPCLKESAKSASAIAGLVTWCATWRSIGVYDGQFCWHVCMPRARLESLMLARLASSGKASHLVGARLA